MEYKKIKKITIVYLLGVIFVNLFIIFNLNFNGGNYIKIRYDIKSQFKDTYQVFYAIDRTFSEEQSEKNAYENTDKYETLKFNIPKKTRFIRIDLGMKEGNINISNCYIEYLGKKEKLNFDGIKAEDSNDIKSVTNKEDNIEIISSGMDPYIILDLNNLELSINKIDKNINHIIKFIIIILINLVMIMLRKKFDTLMHSIRDMYVDRKLILKLARNDFKTKYAGSYLGIIWAFVQPIITVLIYWFVFEVGFKTAPMGDSPFILWLVAGIVPWFFFSEALMNATYSMIDYSYLVKKMVFKTSVLPLVKILSSLFVHLFFILFAMFIYALYGYRLDMHVIQIIYYSICTLILVLGIAYASSAIVIFFKDLGQIINILLQFGMWLTPIIWRSDMIASKYQWILKLNPIYYIVEGYRDAFINGVWFWEKPMQTFYFWIISILMLFIGIKIFKKLKIHFSDVL